MGITWECLRGKKKEFSNVSSDTQSGKFLKSLCNLVSSVQWNVTAEAGKYWR